MALLYLFYPFTNKHIRLTLIHALLKTENCNDCFTLLEKVSGIEKVTIPSGIKHVEIKLSLMFWSYTAI